MNRHPIPFLKAQLKLWVAHAMEEDNQKLGRMLATTFEGMATELREAFGSVPKGEDRTKYLRNREAGKDSLRSREAIRIKALLSEYPGMTDIDLHEDFAILGDHVDQGVIDLVRQALV